jgi:hypothetical protein
MFSKASIRRNVRDIQAMLTAADPAGAPLAASSAARLAALRHRIDGAGPERGDPGTAAGTAPAQTGPSSGAIRAGRVWWPNLPQRHRRRKIVITCVAAPVLAATTAAGWVIASNTPASRVAENIWCWSSPRGGGSVTLPSTGQAPTALCAQQWASGNMTGFPGAHAGVPPLVACSMGSFDGGSVGVYPDTTCQALHLPPLPSDYQQAARSVAGLSGDLEKDGLLFTGSEKNPPHVCRSTAEAIALTEQALQSNGLTGWRIDVRPASVPSVRCAGADPDSASHSVWVFRS